MTMAITEIDEQKLEAFIGHAATELGAALNTALVTPVSYTHLRAHET